jgi:sulfur relay (sulfurtransferase) complex TusBCD TusD component (DsrE family)
MLFVVSTQNKLRDIEGLTSAAVKAGHIVVVFFNEDSVKLLKMPSSVESLYADLLACKASAVEYDISKDNMVGNARMSSLAELVEQLETADRVVFLG